MKELADEFNIFYTSVGVKAAEESKKIAIANNLPSVQPNNLVLSNNTMSLTSALYHLMKYVRS
jgi:hypothetical protein